MEIRKATLNDVQDISRIHALSWKSAYRGIIPQSYLDQLKEDHWEPVLTDWLRDNVISAQLVTENGSTIGCVAYGKSRDMSLPEWGEIVSLYLLPEYFGRGYGYKLFNSALADLRQSDYQSIYLWVLKDNIKARHFYGKNGMRWNKDEDVIEIMGNQLIDLRYVYIFKN